MKLYELYMLPLIIGIIVLGSSCEKKDVDINLSAADWKVKKIRKRGKLIYTATDSTYVLHFSNDNTCNLNLDVNNCVGLYEIPEDGSITFQGMACTKMCCDTEFAEDLLSLFPEMTGYYVLDNKLHLEGDGEIILQLL